MRPSLVSKSSTARWPTTPSSFAIRRASSWAWPASSSARSGRGRDHRVADAVDLLRLDDGVGDGLAVRGADDVRRELAGEVDLLLREDGDTGPERGLGVLLRTDEPDALAVVAAADRLEDDGEAAHLLGERRHIGGVRHDAVARAGRAELVELGAHHALVLRVHQGVGPRADGDAVRLQGPQVLDRDMLVIESDHVAAPRELTQRVQVAIVADDDIADHLGRRVLRGVTEELESDAEGDARLVGHTGELAAADHADYRERHPPRVSAAPARPVRPRHPAAVALVTASPHHCDGRTGTWGALVSMAGLTPPTGWG